MSLRDAMPWSGAGPGDATGSGPLRQRMPRLDRGAIERARLRVVPRRRTQAARVPFVILIALILLAGVVGLLLFNTSMQQASFAATRLDEQARTLTAREQTLAMELDDLREPQRVAEAAQEMGMVPAVTPAFLRLADGTVLGEAGIATRDDNLRLQPRPPRKPAVLDPPPVVLEEVLATTVEQGRGNRGGNRGGNR